MTNAQRRFNLEKNKTIFYYYLTKKRSIFAPKTMEKQERYDRAYMRIAEEWAKLSYSKRAQVGAIIVKDRMIISDGYNGTPTGFDNCCEDENGVTLWYVLHAEANAILKVAASTQSCKDATL